MSFWQKIRSSLGLPGNKKYEAYPDGATPTEKDTIMAIRDLSHAVMDNPNAVELYLTLGNLYRSRGDVERAVQIRESLLIRPELSNPLKAKTYYELGQDYRRAGLLDRAYNAFLEAERMGTDSKLINAEMAIIHASSGNWEKASEYFYALGNKIAEAHYLVRQGEEIAQVNPEGWRKAMRLFNKALKVYPAAIEAWAAIIKQYILNKKWGAAVKALTKALDSIPTEKSFLLFEEIIALDTANNQNSIDCGSTNASSQLSAQIIFYSTLAEHVIPVLAKRPPEFFPNYYGAFILSRAGRRDDAEQWLDKALVMQPNFWFGRLLHLEIARHSHILPPVIDTDLEFFMKQSEMLKRFTCSACALNRDQIFYSCPRCGSWHSATFKYSLAD